MVRYTDPDEHPDLGPRERRPASSPAERLARLREKNASLTGTEAVEAAREVALRRLDARSQSRRELLDAMTSKGFAPETAEEVASRLEAVGLVDDRAYAAMIVRDRFATTGRTGRALTEELRRKGIPPGIIDEALAQIDEDAERHRAADLAERRLRSMGGVDRETAFRRLSGMLARKGYSPAVASATIHDALDSRGQETGGGQWRDWEADDEPS
ncbi:recombination regulator RecX [Actinomyces sp. B33]|uniref:regulatory protein RecX n=1 Tax=Actinomyces sp. B33 TaxID=2942131 RepID=UPI0023409184|nr:regulatory protein RecX [Actinomyces sp. B33]MDC4233054.1 recombination regulator RecX [Actinomyces sp. B33]